MQQHLQDDIYWVRSKEEGVLWDPTARLHRCFLSSSIFGAKRPISQAKWFLFKNIDQLSTWGFTFGLFVLTQLGSFSFQFLCCKFKGSCKQFMKLNWHICEISRHLRGGRRALAHESPARPKLFARFFCSFELYCTILITTELLSIFIAVVSCFRILIVLCCAVFFVVLCCSCEILPTTH